MDIRVALMCVSGLVLGVGCNGERNDASTAVVESADSSRPVPDAGPTMRCNGFAELCPRPYNQVAYATTHNAMSSAERGWLAPNQQTAVPAQLEAGVRAFMLDLHYNEAGVPVLCHSYCVAGEQDLVEGWREFKVYLDSHPNEVVTLILEVYIAVEDIRQTLAQAGLLDLIYQHTAGNAWPSLGELVENGRRLVILSDEPVGDEVLLMYLWTYAWETHWAAEAQSDWSCAVNRGQEGSPLFILNHFLTKPIALEVLAREANAYDVLSTRAVRCREEADQVPNFVTVDFFELGGVLRVVEELNGVDGSPVFSTLF